MCLAVIRGRRLRVGWQCILDDTILVGILKRTSFHTFSSISIVPLAGIVLTRAIGSRKSHLKHAATTEFA